jgi:hypothetical protein
VHIYIYPLDETDPRTYFSSRDGRVYRSIEFFFVSTAAGANNNGLAHGSTAAAEMVVAAPSAAQQVYPYIYILSCRPDDSTDLNHQRRYHACASTDHHVRLAAAAGEEKQGRRRRASAGGGGARDGVEPPGLLARVRGVLAVQPRHGQLQVLRGRAAAVPHGVPLHVQGQVLPGALQLTMVPIDSLVAAAGMEMTIAMMTSPATYE